jgi:hypothetical protein
MDVKKRIELITTKTNEITCQFIFNNKRILLHSLYNPQKEAQEFVRSHIEQIRSKKKIIVYGLGCGYHISEIIEATRDTKQEIEVWDFNVELYNFVKNEKQIVNLLNNDRITLYVDDNQQRIMSQWKRFDDQRDYLIIHPASLRIIPESLSAFKNILETFKVNVNSMLMHQERLNEHFDINVKKAKIDRSGLLNNLLESAPMILVAAGPSLQKSIEMLRKYQDKVFIGCVGTALKPLLSNNIMPDFFMLTDPLDSLSNQFSTVDFEKQKMIPLFYLGTVSPMVISMYAGMKIMLLQEGMKEAEELAENCSAALIKTGGSVATTLLDCLIHLGAKQLCFVGQDLAYSNKQTHTVGTANYTTISDNCFQTLIELDDYFLDGKVYAPRNLYIYKMWIENYIREHSDIQFFNATQGGAHIQGCEHIGFEDFVKKINSKDDVKKYKEEFKRTVESIAECHNG